MLGSSGLIAVDIGSYSVKALDGKWQGSANFSPNHHGMAVIDVSSSGSQVEASVFALQQVLSLFKTKNVELLTAIPLSGAIMRDVSVESGLTEYGVESQVEAELSDSLPFSIDDVYFDYVALEHIEDTYKVAAARKDLIDPLTQSLRDCTSKNTSIEVDIDAYAYGRLISQLYTDVLNNGKVIMLVDVGHKSSRFYFYGAEGLVYNREQQMAGKQMTETVAEVYDMSMNQAENLKHNSKQEQSFHEMVVKPFAHSFAEQIHLVMDFYEAAKKADASVAKIDFVGGGACLKGLLPELEKHLDYPISYLDLSPIWKEQVRKDSDWFEFCANHALTVALMADGIRL